MDMIIRAFKTELKPNKTQQELLQKHVDGARYVYNWALSKRKETYEQTGKSLSYFDLCKELTILKHSTCDWLNNVDIGALQNELKCVCVAYDNFFRGLKTGRRVGFPKFKNKHTDTKSYGTHGRINVESLRVKLPKVGWVKLKERDYIPTSEAKILAAHVSHKAGRWYVSVQVEQPWVVVPATKEPMGIDVGIKALATCSDGTTFDNPKAYKTALKKLARLQRGVNRKVKGSSNREKQKQKVAKLYARITSIRSHHTHEASAYITKKARPSTVAIEDLNVRGLMANHSLAQAISDANMGELHRQLTYKGGWYGVEVVKIDRWYPSSKTCSNCGWVNSDLKLSDRVFVCSECGAVIDRDLNAAINIRNVAVKSTETINACGGESSGAKDRVKLLPDEAGTSTKVEIGHQD
jgi:putative transposase